MEERRTILLVGEFAGDDDAPVGVEIVGTLLTDDDVDARDPSRNGGSSRRWSFHRIGGALPHLRFADGEHR